MATALELERTHITLEKNDKLHLHCLSSGDCELMNIEKIYGVKGPPTNYVSEVIKPQSWGFIKHHGCQKMVGCP